MAIKIPTDPAALFGRYVETCAFEKLIAEEKASLKNAIIAHLDAVAKANGTDGDTSRSACEAGFSVKLTPSVRKTPCKELIEAHFGAKIPMECFKVTSYSTLSVTPVKA